MHRTTTTATLLLTVAVSALSGCTTTVPHPTAPGPSAAPSRPSAPERKAEAETQIVQAPAREALQLIEEASRRPEPATPTTRPPAPPAATPEPGPQPGHRTVRPRPARPEHPEPARRGPRRSHTGLPDMSDAVRQDVDRSAPNDNADVCALGRRYGGWRADSPEATICRDTYGR